MQLFYLPQLSPSAIQGEKTGFSFDENESKHITRALRLREGDTLMVTDGGGFLYDATIVNADIRNTVVEITNPRPDTRLLSNRLHLAIAPTKNPDRMEWLVEKATETGVDEISLLMCDHSERVRIKTDRLERIAVAAMKQSGRSRLPLINEMEDFGRFITRNIRGERFIAWCETGTEEYLADKLTPGADAIVLIGPEGDFSREEVDLALNAGYQPVSLGRFTLRTETAGLAACMMFQQINHRR